MFDEIDLKILDIIQKNARTANVEIARQAGLAPSAILERVRKLEERKVVQSFSAQLDPQALGLGLLAFVFVRSREKVGRSQTGRRLAAIPEVQEVHNIAGEDCYLVKVRARDTEGLGRVLREKIGAIDSVLSTRTTIVLETVKETMQLPLSPRKQDPPASVPRRARAGGAR